MTEGTYRPADAADLEQFVRWAVAEQVPLEIAGAGSKRGFGRPATAAHRLVLDRLSGVTMYEPDELVLTAAAGTPLAEIAGLLAQSRQQLAFEPMDMGPLYGGEAGRQTLGGAVACNLSGPRRIQMGAARDHVLGFRAVTGWGDPVKSGGRVVKNVTGYDLSKLIAGSHGTLAVMHEITVKVLPAPETAATLLLAGQDDVAAVAALAAAAGSAEEPGGLAHLPAAVAARSAVASLAAGGAVTAVRLEGPAPSVAHRAARLTGLWRDRGEVTLVEGDETRRFWEQVRDVAGLLPDREAALWRLALPPTAAPAAVGSLANALPVEAYYDWAGGLVWLAAPATAEAAALVRGALGGQGHATLVRGPDAYRAEVPVFQPQPEPLARLTRRVKESFDPGLVLNRGRMYADF